MRNERSISPDTELKSIYPQKLPVRTATALARSVRVPCCRQRKKGIPRRQAADRRTERQSPDGHRTTTPARCAGSFFAPSSKEVSKQAFRRRTLPFRATFPERSAVRRDRCSGRPIRHGTDRRLFLTISPPTGKSPSGVILISGGPSDRRSDSGRKAHHSPRHGIQTS